MTADLCLASLELTVHPMTGLLTLEYRQKLLVVFYLSAKANVMVDSQQRDSLQLCPATEAAKSCGKDYCQLSLQQPVQLKLEAGFDMVFTHSFGAITVGPQGCSEACYPDGTFCLAGTSCQKCCNPARTDLGCVCDTVLQSLVAS
jgi:hypothetical protein